MMRVPEELREGVQVLELVRAGQQQRVRDRVFSVANFAQVGGGETVDRLLADLAAIDGSDCLIMRAAGNCSGGDEQEVQRGSFD